MPATQMTVDGIPIAVSVSGPDKGIHVVLIGAALHTPATYDTLCERLHTAGVRTVVIGADPRLSATAVVAVLDSIEIPWAVLVGDRFGAEVAWELAAMACHSLNLLGVYRTSGSLNQHQWFLGLVSIAENLPPSEEKK